ncbi:hypothetical protein BMS3Abin17_00394 [archaeon BMS3Abin17]|nr:hypothetical protein BMS3Abin17_00394 [archaeon BMS3Abin17]
MKIGNTKKSEIFGATKIRDFRGFQAFEFLFLREIRK